MNAQIVNLFWAGLTIFVASRIALLMFSRLGDNAGRILLAHGVSYVMASILVPRSYSDYGLSTYAASFAVYAVPAVVWLIVDIARMAHRQRGAPAS